MPSSRLWDIKLGLAEVIAAFPDVSAAHVFGSRAYGTNSLRSDFDLLLTVDRPLPQHAVIQLHRKWPIFDFWQTHDGHIAQSLINGSSIVSREKLLSLRLEAQPLWSRDSGFAMYGAWSQKSTHSAEFELTVACIADVDAYESAVEKAHIIASRNHRPSFSLPFSWKDIATKVVDLIERALARQNHLSKKAGKLGPENLQLSSEYDLQNLLQICLAGIVSDLEPEPFVIKIDGQKKKADLAFSGGKFIIEAKSITDASTHAAVVKTLDGLTHFYRDNPNVEFLLFLVLVVDAAPDATTEARYSDPAPEPRHIVRIVKAIR